jgi:hypothetical protein
MPCQGHSRRHTFDLLSRQGLHEFARRFLSVEDWGRRRLFDVDISDIDKQLKACAASDMP